MDEIRDIFKIKDGFQEVNIFFFKKNNKFEIKINDLFKDEIISLNYYLFNDEVTALNFFESKVKEKTENTSEQASFFRSKNSSPWNKDIYFEIDPLLRNIIKKLHKKLYLTIASCQSHGYLDDCYIDFCFTNLNDLENFKKYLEKKTKGWFFFKIIQKKLNKYFDNNYGNALNEQKDKNNNYWVGEEQAIQTLNGITSLNFKNWYIVRVQIKSNPKNILEKIFLRLTNNWFLKRRLKLFENLLDGLKDCSLF